jgi:hypothetical protein
MHTPGELAKETHLESAKKEPKMWRLFGWSGSGVLEGK